MRRRRTCCWVWSKWIKCLAPTEEDKEEPIMKREGPKVRTEEGARKSLGAAKNTMQYKNRGCSFGRPGGMFPLDVEFQAPQPGVAGSRDCCIHARLGLAKQLWKRSLIFRSVHLLSKAVWAKLLYSWPSSNSNECQFLNTRNLLEHTDLFIRIKEQ